MLNGYLRLPAQIRLCQSCDHSSSCQFLTIPTFFSYGVHSCYTLYASLTTATLTTADEVRNAALQILEQEGPEAVTMRRVAQTAGLSPMAINHYPSRDALLIAITDAEFSKLRALMESRSSQSPGADGLHLLLDAYIDYSFAHPHLFDYVFSKPRQNARRFPDDFHAGQSPTLTLIADSVAGSMLAGHLEDGDVWEISLELWALVHGYIALYRAGRFHLSEAEFRQLCHRAFRRLLHGIQA